MTLPEAKIRREIERSSRGTIQFCFAYWKDLDEAYAFYCARYENITFDEFLNLPLSEFNRKLSSIPESEPLYKIMKSREIKLGRIKDKDQRKYWEDMKRINKIPYAYLHKSDIKPINLGGIL